MPDEYIKRGDALKALCNGCIFEKNCKRRSEFCRQTKEVNSIPAADVEPKQKTGHWVYKSREQIQYERVVGYDIFSGDRHIIEVRKDLSGKYPHCSECDALASDSFMDYCPHCGAKMDGEDKDAKQD